MPEVAILVLNFNGKQFLQGCLGSLQATNCRSYETYLVDNASEDGSVEYTSKNFPKVKIIKHQKNYGFSLGYNKAVNEVNAKYIMLLNNDVEIADADWLTDLLKAIESDKRIAAVSAKLTFANFPSIINSVGGALFRWTGAVNIGSRERDEGQYDNPPIEPFFACGGAMLLRRDAFLSVGGFDSKMFAYSEDLDLCWRLRLKGYRIAYCPKAVVKHVISASWDSYGLYKIYLSERNLLRTMGKNYSLTSLFKNLPLFLLNRTIQMMFFSLLFRRQMVLYLYFRAILWNITNLPDTVKKRYIVQTTRKTREKEILESMAGGRFEKFTEILRKIRFDRKYFMS